MNSPYREDLENLLDDKIAHEDLVAALYALVDAYIEHLTQAREKIVDHLLKAAQNRPKYFGKVSPIEPVLLTAQLKGDPATMARYDLKIQLAMPEKEIY